MKFKSIETSIQEIKEFLNNGNRISLLNITGDFLAGKTSIIKNLISDTEFINQYNVYTYVNDWSKYNYLFDITSEFFENSNLQHPEFISEESKYFVKSFFDSISTLNIANKNLFKEVNEYLLIENDSELNDELQKKINTGISNELKRNLFLHYYEISIECLLTDLLNNFFPLSDNIKSLSEYLISRDPIKILLVFDDAQSVHSKISAWFELLITYLTNKSLSDLMIYDYQGDDSHIAFSEFFEIDLIIVSRDTSFNTDSSIVNTMNIELGYSNEKIDESNEIILNIPALNSYYSALVDNKKEETYIYATNHLLKYINPDYHKAFIFSSIFESFDIKEFNLFEEIELTNELFEKTAKKADFIYNTDNGFKFKKYPKVILKEVYALIFGEVNTEEIVNISNSIRDIFPTIKYSEFEILRELAYFECFDKNYVIDNYFESPKKIYNFIESNIHLFDRDKSFYQINDKYKSSLQNYNKIRDRAIQDEKINGIETLYYNYQIEIEKRNKILQNDVITVGNELTDFEKEKVKMEMDSNLLSKDEILQRNELNEIQQKLKPFQNHNSKRKSTINMAAFFASVAIIFNSDSIAEVILGNSGKYFYVVLLVILILLILYGNGLLRYFRIKFKSEELYSLSQEQKNISNKIEEVEKELELLNADIRAKISKIEDLKKHIERMNLQILENKLKLEKKFII